MSLSLSRSIAASCFAVFIASGAAFAQDASKKEAEPFEPTVGQAGRDVVWVPTPQALVNRMLDMANVTSRDFLVDLGSGDGRTVITAAKRGARAMGVEYNPKMVELSQRNAKKEGVSENAQFVQADLFEHDFSKADVITLFLLPDINRRLKPKLLDMKPGTRVVSNTFDMGDWKADDTISADNTDCRAWCRAYFWLVPAKVEGTWTLPEGTLTLEQKYQFISGTLDTGKAKVQISDGKLKGAEITFVAGDQRFTGTVDGDTMQGTMSPTFKATRKAK